jgi:hypothetical protein
MSIQEISSNFKRFLYELDGTFFTLFLVVGIGAFFLGRYSVLGEGRIPEAPAGATVIEATASAHVLTPLVEERVETSTSTPTMVSREEGAYVASKKGTKYHLPWCGGAKSINEENKIWFRTKEEAEAAGYAPAANCKGI